jgi:hypothetical protein
MIADLENLGRKWAANNGPITDYRVRSIKIAEIAEGIFDFVPFLGIIGKAMIKGVDLGGIKLPKVLWKRPCLPCELFLNDLYKAPSKLI